MTTPRGAAARGELIVEAIEAKQRFTADALHARVSLLRCEMDAPPRVGRVGVVQCGAVRGAPDGAVLIVLISTARGVGTHWMTFALVAVLDGTTSVVGAMTSIMSASQEH